MAYKKMAKGGSAGSRGKMSPRARRDSDIRRKMIKQFEDAKNSRMEMIMEESGKPISQRDMDYIEKGPKFFKDGGAVRGMGAAIQGKKYTGCK